MAHQHIEMNMQRIIKSTNLISDIEKIVAEIKHDKLFVLTDEHTANLCLPLLDPWIAVKDVSRVVIPANDTNKTLENLAHIWKHLTQNGATRHSLLINLGGGMVTDIGGFAAATFKRGITYINIPTTLLGAVDAAVGGKSQPIGQRAGGVAVFQLRGGCRASVAKSRIGALADKALRAVRRDVHHAATRVGAPQRAVGFGQYAFRALQGIADISDLRAIDAESVQRIGLLHGGGLRNFYCLYVCIN